MELREPIETINEQLIKEFGRAFNNWPNFRVVWADDQTEKRWTDHTDEGFPLLHPEVRLLRKYQQFAHKYVLERLIPVVGETDLTTQISYEPVWCFEDKDGNYLPPFFEGCKFIIDCMYAQIGKKGTHAKYRDENVDPEMRMKHVEDVMKWLAIDETDVGDALAHGYGVTVPEMPKKEKEVI